MKRLEMCNSLVIALAVSVFFACPAWAGRLLAWGSDRDGEVSDVPAGTDYVAIAAGDAFGLALTSGGTVVAWGQNSHGQCDVPPGVYVAVGAGARFGLAIRADGSIAAWGDDSLRQVSDVPRGDDFVAVKGGLTFAVALKSDGSIVAWGDDRWGQVSGIPRGNDFAAVAAGDTHAVALRSDGSLACWGYPTAIHGVPTAGGYRAVDAGGNQSLALAGDGTVVWWGEDPYGLGLARVPEGSDYEAVAAGYLHALALTRDGGVVGWGAGGMMAGQPDFGQAIAPKRSDFVAIAGGLYFSLGLTGEVPQTVLEDDFNDDGKAMFWRRVGDDLANCQLEEVNQRLELRSTAKADGFSTGYLSQGWGIDPTVDFAFKVDFYEDLRLGDKASLSVVLTPGVKSKDTEYVKFGVGSGSPTPHFLCEARSETATQSKLVSRTQENGTLYVSYDAALDELYMSFTGYGAADAWTSARGFLQGMWSGRVLTLKLEGRSDRLQIESGQAYLDNFAVESGHLVVTEYSDVFRFWSVVLDNHFWTIDESERDVLMAYYPDAWAFEGPVFRAATTGFAADLAPVYRFWSEALNTHFYTISEAERDGLLEVDADIWMLEGVSFYAYPEGEQPADARPVYRFWQLAENGHFYTIDETEKDLLLKNYRDIYLFEGVAFYAYGQ
jgi:alpha-tubulin suppressor-like RCC1 family protein